MQRAAPRSTNCRMPAVAEVLGLARRVDAHARVELDRLGAVALGADATPSAGAGGFDRRPRPRRCHDDRRRSSPARPSAAALSPSGNCSGRTPMPTRFERWMRSKLCAITARTPSRLRALGGPVARGARAVLLAGEHESGTRRRRSASRRRRSTSAPADGSGAGAARWRVEAALGARRELVAQADVGERAAHHHLVVAAARAVGVEVARLDALLLQVGAGGAVALDRAGRRDVVGRDAVAEQRQHARPAQLGDRRRARRHVPGSRAAGARRSTARPTRKRSPSGTSSPFQRSSPAKTSP